MRIWNVEFGKCVNHIFFHLENGQWGLLQKTLSSSDKNLIVEGYSQLHKNNNEREPLNFNIQQSSSLTNSDI